MSDDSTWEEAVTEKLLVKHSEIPVDLGQKHFEIRADFPGKHFEIRVDFLIADADKISPIEVKSSGYKAHASLDAFCEKFSAKIKNKYLIYTKDLHKDRDILYLPAYMTMFL